MENYSQNESPEAIPKNTFMGFGKFLFIYASFFTIIQILVFISSILTVSDILVALYLNLSLIGTVILLLLLVLNGRKINSNLYPNSKIHVFYMGLEAWLIMNVMVLLGIPLFSVIYVGVNLTIFYEIMLTIADISQIIAWISLYSFFKNPKDLISTKIGKFESISLIIIIIASFLHMLYIYIYPYDPFTVYISIHGLHVANQLYMLIFSSIFVILFIIGYFILSVTLIRKKMTFREKDTDISNTANNTWNGNENISNITNSTGNRE